jgi:hypothetical protein
MPGTISGIVSAYRRFCKDENAFMLYRGRGAPKLQKGEGRFTTSSKVPVPSDHKSPGKWSITLVGRSLDPLNGRDYVLTGVALQNGVCQSTRMD